MKSKGPSFKLNKGIKIECTYIPINKIEKKKKEKIKIE